MMVSTYTVQYPIDIDIDTIEGAISLIFLLPIFTFFSISALNSLLLYFSLNKSYLFQSKSTDFLIYFMFFLSKHISNVFTFKIVLLLTNAKKIEL